MPRILDIPRHNFDLWEIKNPPKRHYRRLLSFLLLFHIDSPPQKLKNPYCLLPLRGRFRDVGIPTPLLGSLIPYHLHNYLSIRVSPPSFHL